jgi:hypothetical protein
MRAGRSNRKLAGQVLLVLGYVCVFALLFNICARLGWFHARIPGLTGFADRWRLALAAAVIFASAWYVGRSGGVGR